MSKSVRKFLVNLIPYLVIILVSIPGLWAFFHAGFFASHDGMGHVIRLSEFHIALTDGQFPVRWSKNLFFGFGYPFFNFNYPLVYYFGELFHLVGASFGDSIKLVMMTSTILSGVFMYLWQKDYWGKLGGLATAALYMYAPYRFMDLYVRGSIGECLAFIFIPLLFHFTEKIAEGDKKQRIQSVVLGSFSLALLILSHNISAFIFSLILGAFMLFHVLIKKSWQLIIYYFCLVSGGLALSAYFWAPAILEKKYTFLDTTIARDYPNHFVYPFQFLENNWGFGASVAGPNDGLSFQIGWVWAGLVFLSLVLIPFFWRRQQKQVWHGIFYLFIFGAGIFLMLDRAKFIWDHFPLLPFVQFPWRFLSWIVFASSILGGFFFFTAQKLLKKGVVFLFLILLASFWFTEQAPNKMWQSNAYMQVPVLTDSPIAGTTTWANEQAPVWLKPAPLDIPLSKLDILAGQAEISQVVWKSNLHQYQVFASNDSILAENTAYYPGWQVFVNKRETPIFYQGVLGRGRITFLVPKGVNEVKVVFGETLMRRVADLISLGTLLILVFFFFRWQFKFRNA